MRLHWAMFVRTVLTMSSICMFLGCQNEVDELKSTACEVGFCVEDGRTRTQMQDDGLSSVWEKDDVLSLWAYNSGGAFVLSNQRFTTYGLDSERGFFTSVLPSPMDEGLYTYIAAYPSPLSVQGLDLLFEIPSRQDGKVSGGADIMISSQIKHGPLKAITEIEDHTGLSIRMNHMLHQFRFYIPSTDTHLGDEKVERIMVTFPKAVAGKVLFNLMNLSQTPQISEGTSSMELRLSEPIGVSGESGYDYAFMAFAPMQFESGQTMAVRAYTASRIAEIDPIDLCARNFESGHSTPVALRIKEINDYCRVRFVVGENYIGEDVQSITLTAPSGCVWGDSGSDTYVYSPGYEFTTGETFEIVFEDVDSYRAFSGRQVTVTYDTEHVKTQQTLTLPDMSQGHITSLSAGLPYLLYEDFSLIETFSSNDGYTGGSISGSKNASSFLGGWTAARAGAQAGKSLRIACRRETSANYPARTDSRPIVSLKKTGKIKVTFDYGMDNEYGGLSITPADFGQKVHVGYVTSTTAYKSGDEDGVFESANSFDLHETGGSYDSTPNNDTFILNDVPAGTVRITWRTTPHSDSGLTNTTCWLYIDNVKVQIAR